MGLVYTKISSINPVKPGDIIVCELNGKLYDHDQWRELLFFLSILRKFRLTNDPVETHRIMSSFYVVTHER